MMKGLLQFLAKHFILWNLPVCMLVLHDCLCIFKAAKQLDKLVSNVIFTHSEEKAGREFCLQLI